MLDTIRAAPLPISKTAPPPPVSNQARAAAAVAAAKPAGRKVVWGAR